MTGFASKSITITKGKDQKAHIAIYLKALNSRYFEVNAKLGYPLSPLETDLIKLFKKTLHRGYIHFTVHLDNPSLFKGAIKPSLTTAKGYVSALKKIKKSCTLKEAVTLAMIAQLPNVFTIEEKGLDKQLAEAIMKVANELIVLVTKEREKEGVLLKKDFEERLTTMDREIKAIAKRSQEHISEKKEKLNALLAELAGDTSEFAETRKNALYTLLDKIDIHEEIVRFEGHLKNLASLLESNKIEKGKRIDFTLQELAREINTITAKCVDAHISRFAINIKVEIEKAREQTQNIV